MVWQPIYYGTIYLHLFIINIAHGVQDRQEQQAVVKVFNGTQGNAVLPTADCQK